MFANKTKLGLALLFLTFSVSSTYAVEEAEFDDESFTPKVRKMKSDEISLDDEFEEFQNGGFFYPPLPHFRRFMGYESKKQLFKDFREHFETGGDDGFSEVSLCEGELGEDSEATMKMSFSCEDGEVTHSCYVDVIDGEYAVNIPSEVSGLPCIITVEAIEVTDDEEDVEVDGVETEDEIVLNDDVTIEINVEE